MNILHLTDLHFSRDIPEEKEQKKWNEILVKVIKICSEKKINVLAITGDFTCHGSEEEFVRAERFIQKLIGKIGLKKEQVYEFITMNTCHKTSLELYERASLTEEDCEKIRKHLQTL